MVKIDVLLATYNGAPYLPEQLDSVFAQEGVIPRVLVRDDDSRDDTLKVVEEYALRYPGRIFVVSDEHKPAGAAANFFRLLGQPSEAPYFAFCDQDDVWLPRKLISAIEALEKLPEATPALWLCGYYVVDKDLNTLGRSLILQRPLGFGNAIVKNVATGAVSVFNRALWQRLRRPDLELTHIFMHDWWAYLLAASFGKVLYEQEPMVLYRQHGNNVLGAAHGLNGWIKRWQIFRSGKDRGVASGQMRYFYELYKDELQPAQRAVMKDICLPDNRFVAIRRVLRRDVYCMRTVDELILIFRMVMGRF
jgi:glycosyltransferase involved in cell wall biosynthesis